MAGDFVGRLRVVRSAIGEEHHARGQTPTKPAGKLLQGHEQSCIRTSLMVALYGYFMGSDLEAAFDDRGVSHLRR